MYDGYVFCSIMTNFGPWWSKTYHSKI